mgnify:CR=1 FL=1
MLQWFAEILIDILLPLKSSWPSRSSSWSIVLDQHIGDSSNLLTSDKYDINTWFHVIQISIFSLLRTRLSTIWEKYISSYLLISKRKGVVTKNPLLQFDKRYCHAFENIHVCLTVYTCSASFVTFIFFFYYRLFWKRETIPCAVHELINIIITNSEYTVMIEQKVSIGLQLHKRTN